MDLYILDSLLRREVVVDDFESLIWTDRYSSKGDFELDIKSTNYYRSVFVSGTKLAVTDSYSVMVVQTVEDADNSDGKDILKVKGFSLEDILDDRVVKHTLSDTTTEPSWVLTGTPGNIARTMFDYIVRDGALDVKDRIPFLQPGTLFAPGTNPEYNTELVVVQQPALLYSAIKALCDPYDLGIRLVRNFDSSELYFEIYTGDDRTTRQTAKPAVVFSPGLDSIQNTTEMTNVQGAKNVAYVFSPAGFKVVYGDHVPEDVDGFDRHILVVNDSTAVDDPDADTKMIQAGTEALNNARATHYFDGEINQYNSYKYLVDYNLGDIVEIRNRDGVITYERVTENILVSDGNGDRSYPTLTADVFIGANTWLSYNALATTWEDYDADTDTTWYAS